MILVQVLVQHWKQLEQREKLQNNSLYVTCGEVWYLIIMDHWGKVANLKSIQVEADICLFLHACHTADEGYASAVITAEDIDILVLS